MTSPLPFRAIPAHFFSVTAPCFFSASPPLLFQALNLVAFRMPWSTDMGTEVMVCEGHKAAIINCKMDRSGEVILSASEDCTMILWDATHGTPLQYFIGHGASISEVTLCGIPTRC